LEKGGQALGAIVLDDDFMIGGEIIFYFEPVWEAEGKGGDEFVRGCARTVKFLQDGLFKAGSDSEEKVGLAEEGQAKSLVVYTGGEFVRPGEDVGAAEANAGGLGLIEEDLFFQGEGGFIGPFGVKVLEKVAGLIIAEEEAGENTLRCGQFFDGVSKAVIAIDEGAEELAVAGAHLLVVAEEAFQPGMQGYFALVSVDDRGSMAELVIGFHDGL
jgi:hypothetical protein